MALSIPIPKAISRDHDRPASPTPPLLPARHAPQSCSPQHGECRARARRTTTGNSRPLSVRCTIVRPGGRSRQPRPTTSVLRDRVVSSVRFDKSTGRPLRPSDPRPGRGTCPRQQDIHGAVSASTRSRARGPAGKRNQAEVYGPSCRWRWSSRCRSLREQEKEALNLLKRLQSNIKQRAPPQPTKDSTAQQRRGSRVEPRSIDPVLREDRS